MHDIETWWEEGEDVALSLGSHERRIFVWRGGAGPAITLLHGWPASSHDWARVAPALARERRLVAPDFLGFGASEKPEEHQYSIHEQADLVEALWARDDIASTALVAHDYAVSVAQELLARRAEGTLEVELTGVVLLNGGLYPDLHRPEPVQTALLDPETGPQLSAGITGELLVGALAPTVGPGSDPADLAGDLWKALARDDGHRRMHQTIRYVLDRREHAERWTGALEGTDVPLAFVWGMLDPVSGAHMADRIRERLPAAPFTALDDVGHWPPLEAPERVVEAALALG